MRFISLAIKGMHPFPDEVKFNFPTQKKIAIVGGNGAGKTTMLDCIPMALYGKSPNRPGSFYSNFIGNASSIEFTWESGGQEYTIKRFINAKTRNQQAWLYLGIEPVNEGKVSDFDEALKKYFPISYEMFLASVFHAQSGAGNPLAIDEEGRRRLLSDILNLSRFDEPFMKASEALSETDRELRSLVENIAVLEDKAAKNSDLDVRLQGLQAGMAEIDRQSLELQGMIDGETNRLAEARANSYDYQKIKSDLDILEKDLAPTNQFIQNLEAASEKLKAILDQEKEILESVNLRERLQTLIDERSPLIQALDKEIEGFEAQKLYQIKLQSEVIEEKRKVLYQTQADFSKLNTSWGHKANAIENKKARLKVEIPRVGLMAEVPCNGMDIQPACKLMADTLLSKEIIDSIQAELPALELELIDLEAQKKALSDQYDSQKKELEALETDYRDYCQKQVAVEQKNKLATLKQEVDEFTRSQLAIRSMVELAPALEQSKETYSNNLALIEGKKETRAAINKQAGLLLQKLADLKDVSSVISNSEKVIAEWKDRLDSFKRSRDETIKNIANIELRIEELKENKLKHSELLSELNELHKKHATLVILKEGLSPKGARALKIDSSVQAIEEIINQLLMECFPEFSVEIRTLKELTSGEQREALQFVILDNATGAECLVECKSGGEQALIKEVISLAFSIMQKINSGYETQTLIRDECSAPLSEINTLKYLNLLDKACLIGGFLQIYYVSHKPSAQEACDAAIFVGNGKIHVSNA